ncbi:MAG: efflux RND transporter permease subunit [Oceanospirillaceae bacterium]|nr:efflux RND transporter permease subunit [Oceanospirillaceae bacterium]MCP5334122.1 efflux RND transporter permease subunit [Oceanospirillaceae bacterium]
MIAWFARNHVAANLFMVTILALGAYSLDKFIPLEVFPDFESNVVSVNVSLPGSSPEEAEQSLAILVEEAVQDLSSIEKITSRSSEGSAKVSIEIADGYNARDALADIKSRVDAINTFPADAERPVISLAEHKVEVITLVVSGDQDEMEIRQKAETLRDQLLAIPGITQVELDGIRDYEISLSISADKLREYNLTLDQVAQTIRSYSQDISAGNLRTDGGDILIRSRGQAYNSDEFANIPIIQNKNGATVYLRELAEINNGFSETELSSRFNGKNAAFIDVYRVGDQSAIQVADKVKAFIVNARKNLPQGMSLDYWRDRSEVVKKRLETLTSNALQGGILVLIILALFLRPAIAFWVFIGIPVSFMGAFIVMPFFGVTLNVMSLFAFILVLGIVVDDAIVTGENVYTHLKSSESGLQAAIRGTQEVAVPVTFGVLTTIAAFLPLSFVEGDRGAMFTQIPVVVIPILLFSLLESKFVLPAHLKNIRLKKTNGSENKFSQWQQNFANNFEKAILRYYQPLLNLCLKNRLSTVLIFCGILVVMIALVTTGWTRFVFFPRIQSEVARVSLEMPAGTPFDVTDSYIKKMSDSAFALKQRYAKEGIILDIQAVTGGNSGNNTGKVMFEIVPPEERTSKITSAELVEEWRKLIGPLPGAESVTFRAEFGRGGEPIDIQLTGNASSIAKVSELIKQELGTYAGVFDIADSLSDGKDELDIELTATALASGMTRESILSQIRQAYFGITVERIQRGRDDVKVMLRQPLSERSDFTALQHLLIRDNSGNQIPLVQLVKFKPGSSPASITRINRERTVNITADINKQTTNMVLIQNSLREFLDKTLQQYPSVHYSFEGEAREQQESFSSLLSGLGLIFFMIYCLLAIPFKSYSQPLIVMSVIPFGIIGAIMGHWMLGADLSLMSLMGMMALVGVVVNDSLVMVDYINQHRASGMQMREAVLNAGAARFRPIFLTSITTFIGLVPLLFEQSTQAQFLIPMAISLGFGIMFATFITLFLVPVNYTLMEGFKRRMANLFHPKEPSTPA